MHMEPPHTTAVECYFSNALYKCQKWNSTKSSFYFSTFVSVLYYLCHYSNVFSIPPFFFLFSFPLPLHTEPLCHIARPLSASPPLVSISQLCAPSLFLCICPLTVCLSFHTSVYTHSLVPSCPSLPPRCVQPYMVREHHGPLVVRAQEIQSNYQTLTVEGWEVVGKTH